MLEGEKVVLRPVEPADAERVQRWLADVEGIWFGPDMPPGSRTEVERWLSRLGSGQDSRARMWAVDTHDGRHVGLARIADVDWRHRRARLDVMIGQPEFRGRGLEADALRALLRVAFGYLNLHRVEARIPASRADLVEACRQAGLTEEARLRQGLFAGGEYVDEVVLAALAGDARSGAAPAG